MQRIDMVNKKVYYNYNNKGELIEIIILAEGEYDDIRESWLYD